jgi:DNA (cytosine-5)-methyltransferase 1
VKKRPTVLSLYTGAGGLDYGFEAAGYKTGAAVEFDPDACRTLRSSRQWPVIERNIFDVSTAEMIEAAGTTSGEIDVVMGGPPCQPFSKSGYWATGDSMRLNDPRSNTLTAFLRVVEEARPRVVLLENVSGLAYQGKDDGLQLLLSGLEAINRRTRSLYRPTFAVLNAADYGVPQLRERFFLIAARDGTRFRFPSPTHRPKGGQGDLLGGSGTEAYRTAWDAISDVQPTCDEDLAVGGKWASLLPSIPEGQNYLWHTERGGGRPLFGWRRRYWTFLLKLAKSKPSWTIQAQPGPAVGPFHWASRRLSIRELCRLQTFPDNVTVTGGRIAAQRQIGNAVPSLMAEVLARTIGSQLLGRSSLADRPLRLLPPVRLPVPMPEKVVAVPLQFRSLEGRHSPHPGTGLGHGARGGRAADML